MIDKNNKAVFFDRDGVLINTNVVAGKPFAIRRVAELSIIPGVVELIDYFKARGYLIIVVTNQPDVGNGILQQATVEAMHQLLAQRLAIDEIKVCYHSQHAGCSCRKPQPGMLCAAAHQFNINLTDSIMIGDRPSDIVAGTSVGCFTILVDYEYNDCFEIEPDLKVTEVSHIIGRLESIKVQS